MKTGWIKGLLFVFLFALGLGIGWGYGHFKLQGVRADMGEKIEACERKASLLRKKYAETKALEAQLLRTKLALEGQKRAVLDQLKEIEGEKAALDQEKQALKAKVKQVEGNVAALKAEIAQWSDRHAALEKERSDLQANLASTVEKHEEEVRAFNEKRRELEARLQEADQHITRCETYNAELCIIGEKLLKQYEGKGIMDSLAQNEPFTRIHQVKLEHFIQEYRDKIEERRLEMEKGRTP